MLPKFGSGRQRFASTADAQRGTLTLRERMIYSPRKYKYPIETEASNGNSRSICRFACWLELFSIFGSILVMLGLVIKTDGCAVRTFGKTGAPGDVRERMATIYFEPSRCKAFDVARVGMRS